MCTIYLRYEPQPPELRGRCFGGNFSLSCDFEIAIVEVIFPDVIRHPVFGFFKVIKLFDHQPFLFAGVVNVNPIFHPFGCCSCYRQCFYFLCFCHCVFLRFLFFPCGNCILPYLWTHSKRLNCQNIQLENRPCIV